MITSLKTATAFTLDAASMLQTQQDKPDHMDQQAWYDLADDLKKVAQYCASVGDGLDPDRDKNFKE